jgi:hypothetical protein
MLEPNRLLRRVVLVTVVAVSSVLVSCASGDVAGFDAPPTRVRDYSAFRAELDTFVSASPHLKMETIGVVGYGEFEAPLLVVRFDGADGTDRPLSVLATGGVHGNEPAGAAWTLALVRELAARPELHAGTAVDVIPVVNPWGWAHDIRYNADGRDINRDFASWETQEAILVRDFLEDKVYDVVIDHHEDPGAAGFYVYQYGTRDEKVTRGLIDRIRSAGIPIEQDVTMVILRTDDGLIDAPMWGLRYMRVTRQLSITNYIRLHGNRTVYTVETPVSLPVEQRVEAHRIAYGHLVQAALQARDGNVE